MDWLKTLLKNAGLDDSKIDGIVTDAGKELPKHFIPKSQYNELTEAKKQAEQDREKLNGQLEDLKKSADASEGLKKEIERLQGENTTAKQQYETDLQDLKLTNAISAALNGKVHNEKVVTGMIDKAKLVIGDDGKVVGLDEQLKGLQTSDAYLFKPDEAGGAGGFRVGNPGQGTGQATNDQLASIFGVAETK
ncbi:MULTISPECIES: phage scaffolding protein [unclassified Paenibacillus]|uniref:phage scaffolding protein n=1 Tax=unclassified Paenibacillus TaxID=185978 RepID=UPI0009A8352E|nr:MULTISPECIES: phage scaffolding protein [unclassified Paenibacillus]SLJ92715.1 Phage minor structural protein GP20 [Paenibacillus sp. RU5A]SOC58526.1 Phage minor structural protein GP20 [Paenibacillus sp. RU26A]SOC67578.1 Phage minor structural protein GP20 [Paenibacillus sp. RU5M]